MQIRQLENVRGFQSVVAFLSGGRLSSSAGDTAAALAEVRETLAKIGTLAMEQHEATDPLRILGILAREQRRRLHVHHLRPIVGVARMVLPERQGDVPTFTQPPKYGSLASVIARAHTMADASRQHTEAFVPAGLRADFIDQLTATARHLQKQAAPRATIRARRVDATRALRAAMLRIATYACYI